MSSFISATSSRGKVHMASPADDPRRPLSELKRGDGFIFQSTLFVVTVPTPGDEQVHAVDVSSWEPFTFLPHIQVHRAQINAIYAKRVTL